MNTTNDMTKEMKILFKFLFRAPANVRPGYRVTNRSVGFYIDPLTTSKIEKEEVIVCSDIRDSVLS